ncbi:MAG TPA: hypothetical protein PL010_10715 [Flavobacteriales bacterium]|nr:hypothetical protein [Flavobacteriales bacterium]HNM69547.1 hypothetical protein [Flavobacteriales bacterium]
MKNTVLLSGMVLFFACSSGPTEEQETRVADTTTVAHIDLTSYGLPLLLTPPDKQLTAGAEPSIIWKDETGTLTVEAGERFGLEIREEPGDMPRLKATLERDLLRKNTIIRETPELLVWRSEFPDDPDLVSIHFYRILAADGRTFTVQDSDGPAYSEQDVDRMSAAISTRSPA